MSKPIGIEGQRRVPISSFAPYEVIFAQFGEKWFACCPCGFRTKPHYTFEAAGREYDLHLAEKFPIGSQRFPCNPPLAQPDRPEVPSTPLHDKTDAGELFKRGNRLVEAARQEKGNV